MTYDLFIIGGGINGAGIACDAAGRGLSVYLCDKGDFASGTSSKSSQLIHGGLRYLETLDFKLVRKALKERETLMFKAPHLIKPMPFLMPYNPSVRSTFLIRLGVWIYEHLAKKRLPSSTIDLNQQEVTPLKLKFQKGIKYFDCWVDDARLVISNLIQAKELGAKIYNYCECIEVQPEKNYWNIKVINKLSGEISQVQAKVIINAAGPWADQIKKLIVPNINNVKLSLVQGSHIMVPKWYKGNHAYLLQTKDKRVVFVIPVDKNVIIGTTDRSYEGDLVHISISEEEVAYLLSIVNSYFKTRLHASQIIHNYSGVRALFKENKKTLSAISRDYTVEKLSFSHLSYINVYGGKITTYRQLAEHVLAQLLVNFPKMGKSWTKFAKLPGANFDKAESLYHSIRMKYPWLPERLLLIYLNRYGSFVDKLLSESCSMADMGQKFGDTLYQREVDYLLTYEWVKTIDDILWRRTKLGITFSNDDKSLLKQYIKQELEKTCEN